MIYSHATQRHGPDELTGTEMGIAALTDALGEEHAVDLLALELCNMAGIEIAYQWRPGNGGFFADYLVAIPNAGPPLDWDRAFRRIRSPGHDDARREHCFDPATMSALAFGSLVVEEGEAGRREMAARHPGEAHRIGHESPRAST